MTQQSEAKQPIPEIQVAPRTRSARLRTWCLWILVTAAGMTLGWALLATRWVVVGGFVMGVGQWFILRHWVRYAGWWILATLVPWVLFSVTAWTLLWIMHWIVIGTIVGTLVGLSQWLVLHRKVKQAFWWIPLTALAWAGGWTVDWVIHNAAFQSLSSRLGNVSPEWLQFAVSLLGGPPGGIIVGAVTGMALVILLARTPD